MKIFIYPLDHNGMEVRNEIGYVFNIIWSTRDSILYVNAINKWYWHFFFLIMSRQDNIEWKVQSIQWINYEMQVLNNMNMFSIE